MFDRTSQAMTKLVFHRSLLAAKRLDRDFLRRGFKSKLVIAGRAIARASMRNCASENP
jgi:hypothetical protein